MSALLEPGHWARIGFPFKAKLATGTYLVNAGAMGICEGEKIYLYVNSVPML